MVWCGLFSRYFMTNSVGRRSLIDSRCLIHHMFLMSAILVYIYKTVFPTHSFICGGPPQYEHCPPQIDFPFVELLILFNHSDSTAVNNITLNTPTQWMAMWLLVYQ